MNPSRAASAHRSAVRVLIGIVVGLSMTAAEVARPATFEDLFTVSVQPDPEASNARTDAIRRGMGILLTRVTGLRQAADDPRLAGLVANAPSLLDSYSPVSDDETRIGFLRAPVIAELTRLGLPIWSDERPSTLLWIAMDFGAGRRAEIAAAADGFGRDGGGRSGRDGGGDTGRDGGPLEGVASATLPDADSDVFTALSEEVLGRADARGLPIVLPRLDATDRRDVRFADVWGGFDPPIERAAARYGTDSILIGRVSLSDAGPRVRWILRQGESRQEFTTLDPGEGVERLADMFAAEYTIVGGSRPARLTIRGIETWTDYGRVLEYLNSVSIIERVDVESLSREGELVLAVVARGDDSQLRQVLSLGPVLALPVTDAPPPAFPGSAASPPAELVFLPAWRVIEAATDATNDVTTVVPTDATTDATTGPASGATTDAL